MRLYNFLEVNLRAALHLEDYSYHNVKTIIVFMGKVDKRLRFRQTITL